MADKNKSNVEDGDIIRDIFDEATGLKYLTDDVISAAYKIYKFIRTAATVKRVKSDYVVIDGEEKPWKDILILIGNLEPLIDRYGYEKFFNLRMASKELNISNIIVKKWLDEAIEAGILDSETIDNEIFFKFNKNGVESILTRIEMEVLGYKRKLVGKDESLVIDLKTKSQVLTDEKRYESRKPLSELEEKFYNIVRNIERKLDEMIPGESLRDSDILVILRSIRAHLDSELAFEILNCVRLKKLSEGGLIQITVKDVDACKKVLKELERLR